MVLPDLNEGISVPLHEGADVSTSSIDIFEGGVLKQNQPCIIVKDLGMMEIFLKLSLQTQFQLKFSDFFFVLFDIF